ncbi:PREDICTED: histone-lysine N-methyltransferase 2D-like isoform X1 [Lepidothrix coronata]|uniref:Histone-lysine N-methyltransferase 2D-like isoform X1 n=1 Tax=Lepidothrix coronata TaxID=321398 RepID=A0A6J0GPB4_9PASS|nr:PREDICTED: histone-lysine N-methyltransferase 2D-like isoform X1 [Lepidothrix coronata]
MASVSLLQLLDDAIGTPEVNVNLEALRKLLKLMLDHLRLLGMQDVLPSAVEETQPAGSHPGLQKEGRTEAGAQDMGQQPQEPGEQLSRKDLLQGTKSGPPVTSMATDMEKTEAKESGISDVEAPPSPRSAPLKIPPSSSEATALSQDPYEDMAGMKATQSHMGEEIQRIKEALGQATDLCEDLRKEVDEMKATQSHMEEDIQMIQKALGQQNLHDPVGHPLSLHDQSASTKPHISDMETLGSGPDTQSTTPGIQTETPSAQSGTTGTQPGSQAGHPAVERITRDLCELQGHVTSLQGLASDLQGLASDLQSEKEKIRQLEDALGKQHVADGRDEISQLEPALQEVKQEQNELREEQKELREEQKITKATLKQLVTANQLKEKLDELRAMVGSVEQKQAQAASPDQSSDTKVLKKLLHDYEILHERVDSLVSQQVQRSLPQKSQQDEELLKSIQATVVRVEGDCEQLGYVTGSLRDDHRQQQKDIEALFRSLESLEKKADKEDLLLLKEDKASLGSKVNCTQFEASMESLEERMREMLKRVLSQEQRWQEVHQQLRDALDSKLDHLELGPFQKQMEETWGRMIKELKDEMSVTADDAAGIKQQLLVPYKCLSCDRDLNMQVPGPHIDTLPFYPPMPVSHAAHPTTIITEEQAQQHGYRKVPNGRSHLKMQSDRGQYTSNAQLKDALWLSKKPGVTKLLGTDGCINHRQKHRPKVAVRAQDKLARLISKLPHLLPQSHHRKAGQVTMTVQQVQQFLHHSSLTGPQGAQ